ncbi:MAG TPA: hypothetical protein VFX89_20975 [Gammaproteobacteria bacterium]|nr:hypothetical protein [Gammaproteobacteria bacterium]
MIEVGGSPDIGAVAALVVISFCSFVTGTVFRKWPDKVQAYTENLDGSAWVVGLDAHRAMIGRSGAVLVVLSFAALVAAAYLL